MNSQKMRRALAALAEAFDTPDQPPPITSRWMRAVDSPLGEKTVRKLVRDGVLTSARPTKHLMVDQMQHDAWIAEHTPKSSAVPAEEEAKDIEAAFGVVRTGARKSTADGLRTGVDQRKDIDTRKDGAPPSKR